MRRRARRTWSACTGCSVRLLEVHLVGRTVLVFEAIDRRAVVPDVPKQHLADGGLLLCRAITRLFRVVLRDVPCDREPLASVLQSRRLLGISRYETASQMLHKAQSEYSPIRRAPAVDPSRLLEP